jgi:hypothetical protein
MGCKPGVCRPYNLGTASRIEWYGHSTWILDYRDAMPKYGVYFQSPCLSVLFTFFNDGRSNGEYRGTVEYNAYRQRMARLYYGSAKAPPIWEKSYSLEECGSEPFDDLYMQHAIAMGEMLNQKGKWIDGSSGSADRSLHCGE